MTELEENASACGLTVDEYEAELKDCTLADEQMQSINEEIAKQNSGPTDGRGKHQYVRRFSDKWIRRVAEAGWQYEDLEFAARNKTGLLEQLVEQVEAIRAATKINTEFLRAGAPKVDRRGRPKGSKNRKKK